MTIPEIDTNTYKYWSQHPLLLTPTAPTKLESVVLEAYVRPSQFGSQGLVRQTIQEPPTSNHFNQDSELCTADWLTGKKPSALHGRVFLPIQLVILIQISTNNHSLKSVFLKYSVKPRLSQ